MEKDTHLKKILFDGAEVASVNFTDVLMQRINALSTNTLPYQPLVSNAIKKVFICIFAGLVLLILVLCLVIASPELSFLKLVKIPQLSADISYKIVVFIFLFWLVFATNYLIQKKTALK